MKVIASTLTHDSPQKGSMKVAVTTKRGIKLTKEYGFTVQEENGSVLAFDLINHPDLGITLLFGNQVFVLKFWDTEDLHAGLRIVSDAINIELDRRTPLGISKTKV